jgi:hypothetical protein
MAVVDCNYLGKYGELERSSQGASYTPQTLTEWMI